MNAKELIDILQTVAPDTPVRMYLPCVLVDGVEQSDHDYEGFEYGFAVAAQRTENTEGTQQFVNITMTEDDARKCVKRLIELEQATRK